MLSIISLPLLGRIEIDEVLSVEFPYEKIKISKDSVFSELDGITYKGDLTNYSLNTKSGIFNVSTNVVVDKQKQGLNWFPTSSEDLESRYKKYIKSFESSMNKKSFGLSERLQIDIDGFLGYHLIFRDSLTSSRSTEVVVLDLNAKQYFFTYYQIDSLDEGSKEGFFNSIVIKNPEDQIQIKESSLFDNKILKMIFWALFTAGAFYFRKITKDK